MIDCNLIQTRFLNMTRYLYVIASLLCICTWASAQPAGPALTIPGAPAVGVGLDGVSYYMVYSPFTDLIKTIRWIDVASWDANGYPASATAGATASGRMAVSAGSEYPTGDYILTWEGTGKVGLPHPNNAQIIPDGPNRFIVRLAEPPEDYGFEFQITSYPVTNIRLYLPGLEKHSSRWNPAYLAYMEPFRGSVFRFMDLNGTNGSQQRNWNDRSPANWSSFANNNSHCTEWSNKGKVPYEYMAELCNQLDCDMWINIPHQATDEYVANLAKLIKTGIDPVSGKKTGPALDPKLRVWLEYSNEVWNWNFKQSGYVNEEEPSVVALGGSLDERYARKAVQLFNVFKESFGDDARIVRVLGTQVGAGGGVRTKKRIEAVNRADFDAIAITTYFNDGFQQYLNDNWPLTQDQALDHLEKNIGAGPFRENEPNKEGVNAYWSYRWAREAGVPVIAYEGNDHINPVGKIVGKDGGKKKIPLTDIHPEATAFIHDMVRTPRFAEVYKRWLIRHQESGLSMDTPFVLLAGWSKYGQWGHVEYVGQTVEEAVKYKAILDLYKLKYPVLEKQR